MGNFPVRSIDGMPTVFILYDWTTNSILINPVENTKSETLVRVFKTRIEYLAKRGFKPKFNIMGNVASKAVKLYLRGAGEPQELYSGRRVNLNLRRNCTQCMGGKGEVIG